MRIANLHLRVRQTVIGTPELVVYATDRDFDTSPEASLDPREVEDLRDACDRFLNGEHV